MTTPLEPAIKDVLRKEGIFITGIAQVHPMSVPDVVTPQAILKNAKSVICYGVPIPKGIIYADTHGLALYWRYCNMVYRWLDILSIKLAVVLEETGYTAAPVYACYPWKVIDREFWGLIPLVYWAEKAGIGNLTKCGLLGTPEYGTRVLLGGVITTAPLPPSEPLTTPVCPSDCFECVQACPVTAIKEGKVDHNQCIRHAHENPLIQHLLQGNPANSSSSFSFSFETIINTVGVDDHGTYLCFACIKACPLNK